MAKQTPAGQIYAVGIDDGRAYTKLYAGNGQQLKIRTSVKPGVHAGMAGLAADSNQGSGVYTINGSQFTVGDRIAGEDTRFADFDGSVINLMAIHHVLVRAGFSNEQVAIATGLPVNSFYLGGAINEDYIELKRDALSKPIEKFGDGGIPAIISKNIVFSEALAAWMDHVLDEEGNILPGVDITSPVGVVDFGGRTFDTLWINPPGEIDHGRSGTTNIGVLNLFDLVGTAIKKEFKQEASRNMLEQAVSTKIITLYGETHDVTDIVAKAGAEIAEQAHRDIHRKFGSAIAELSKIIFVGGGVAALPQIAEPFRNAVIPKDPEFANARGLYKFLRHTLEK
ncbi:plasmid segregation protein ParM domain-containing protein [Methylobacillus sp. Pita2]|uniref:plasmid segregation protein ParM domain-containing protein n=1 Tax=Methylobacillus sp. Pita2 TaxID=3383245 RepID=UPI0038B46481